LLIAIAASAPSATATIATATIATATSREVAGDEQPGHRRSSSAPTRVDANGAVSLSFALSA
jgi:hypothetical protein